MTLKMNTFVGTVLCTIAKKWKDKAPVSQSHFSESTKTKGIIVVYVHYEKGATRHDVLIIDY